MASYRLDVIIVTLEPSRSAVSRRMGAALGEVPSARTYCVSWPESGSRHSVPVRFGPHVQALLRLELTRLAGRWAGQLLPLRKASGRTSCARTFWVIGPSAGSDVFH